MKSKGRLLPNWVPNIILFSAFFLLSVFFSCKVIALGYTMAKMRKPLQNLKGWNQYYRAEVLKEFSEKNIMKKAEEMKLSLSVPDNWRIKDVENPAVFAGKNNDIAEAATESK